MAVRYIRVRSISDMFSPVDRPTGNIAIVGDATAGDPNVGVEISTPSDASDKFGKDSDLAKAIALAYRQTPGPPLVYGIRIGGGDVAKALAAAEFLTVQFVVLANTALDAGGQANIALLHNHVVETSNTGGDGKERMGVAMLAKGETDPTIVAGAGLDNDRMVYIAHRSNQDAAAAVAGTIAGYDPHISLLLKPVAILSDPFTSGQINTINNAESDFDTPPQGNGVNWLVDPDLIPGHGTYMGEGYTGDPGGAKRFIDIVRTIDDTSFRLKARLIKSIGMVRISRSGLRALTVQMEAVLDPLIQNGVIESYEITIPVLVLLDKDPASLTPAQAQAIKDARDQRIVQALVAVVYAGAIHRLAISLKFE